MNSDNWDSAIVKAVLAGFVPLLVYWLFVLFHISTYIDVLGWFISFLLMSGVYLVTTFVLWLVIGFPVHKLAAKYLKSTWLVYLGMPFLFFILLYFFYAPVLAYAFLLFSLVQSSVFRFYVYAGQKP